jgi:hypothetical protein
MLVLAWNFQFLNIIHFHSKGKFSNNPLFQYLLRAGDRTHFSNFPLFLHSICVPARHHSRSGEAGGTKRSQVLPLPLLHIEQRLKHFICSRNQLRCRCVGMLVLYEIRHLLIQGYGRNGIPHILQLRDHLFLKNHPP